MKSLVTFVWLISGFFATSLDQGNQVSKKRALEIPVARVEVLGFETDGKFLGSAEVISFESSDHKNLVGKFHEGIAEGVPFGVYRIEGRLSWHFSEVRYVAVYQEKTTVVLGLVFSHELPIVALALRGRVVGDLKCKKCFVKLTGVFSNFSAESLLDSKGEFEIGGLNWGDHLLLVAGESGMIASKLVHIPYSGEKLEVVIGRDSVPN